MKHSDKDIEAEGLNYDVTSRLKHSEIERIKLESFIAGCEHKQKEAVEEIEIIINHLKSSKSNCQGEENGFEHGQYTAFEYAIETLDKLIQKYKR